MTLRNIRDAAGPGASEQASGGNRGIKVLYVAGWGRSGSTVLGRIFGQIEDFFLVGEMRYIWDRGVVENWLCSCGASFDECPIWREVASRTLGGGGMKAEDLVRAREDGLRNRHLLLTPTEGGLRRKTDRMGGYVQTLRRLYEAAQNVGGGRVIVDTSKFPSYGYALQNTPGIDLYVLHLVRDPRAVAYSWEAKKKLRLHRRDQPGVIMVPHSSLKSSLAWDEWNFATERIGRRDPSRYMLLRYEDFVRSPRESVQNVLRFLGEETVENPFRDERTVSLGVPHTFSGNPDRFRNGPMTIAPDEAWRRNMAAPRQAMVAALTWPGLLRYGYPLAPQRGPARQG